MTRAEPSTHSCDGRLVRAFDLLGKRWSGLLLATLRPGPAGFSELGRALSPISDSMLSERLTELTEAGLISRAVTDSKPPGASYQLTDAGAALLPVLEELAKWAAGNLHERPAG
jgi:DNA-binding HxlR family transcriptional regulator